MMMKILFYSIKDFEHPYLNAANSSRHVIQFHASPLSLETVFLSKGFDCVCVFTADDVSATVIEGLQQNGVKYIAVRAAGYDNIDLGKSTALGVKVANVPGYSPYAVAEHATALILALNRKLILADRQVHKHNFKLDRLIGFDLQGKTVGIIGTGRIGSVMTQIMHGFGCRLLAYDPCQLDGLRRRFQLEYTSLVRVCNEADIITIHCPLNNSTKSLIDKTLLTEMKKGVMLINTARGAVINTCDLIEFIENGTIGYYGMDVYEKEKGVFFYDYSDREMNDIQLQKLLAMPNVLITPHQAFATKEALANIAATTFYNIDCWALGRASENELVQDEVFSYVT